MTEPYAITYEKADSRYYLSLDGQKVGWVSKGHDGKWTCWATVSDSLTGTVLARGYDTRRDAVMEGVAALYIWHLGRITVLNRETYKDEALYLDNDRLRATWSVLLDKKFAA